jgi:hypothetical protein
MRGGHARLMGCGTDACTAAALASQAEDSPSQNVSLLPTFS